MRSLIKDSIRCEISTEAVAKSLPGRPLNVLYPVEPAAFAAGSVVVVRSVPITAFCLRNVTRSEPDEARVVHRNHTRGFAVKCLTVCYRKFAWSVCYLGWKLTAQICAAKLVQAAGKLLGKRDWCARFTESRFDNRFGVDTVEMVPTEQLDVDEVSRSEATRYEATPYLEFGVILPRLGIRYEEYAFIDFGSGKGRVLMMASRFSFKRIIGLEFSRALHRVAGRNLEQYGRVMGAHPDCRSLCCDATSYELPPDPTVLYFFNPFTEAAMSRVLENIYDSLRTHPRHLLVIYNKPVHRDLLDTCGFLTPVDAGAGNRWVVYEASAVPLGCHDEQPGERAEVVAPV